MEFEITNENGIIAWLSNEDLRNFEMSYDEMNYSDEKTRKVLKTVLLKAKNETKSKRDFSSKLRIDVMPASEGGCLILFTDLSDLKEEADFERDLIFETESFDNIADCAKALSKLNISLKDSILYADNEKLRLVVSGATGKAVSVISEFLAAVYTDDLSFSRTEEYMKCLIKQNALEILCGKGAQS